ncbi:hypothetical protein F2Q70_00007697 [Brassica cretica]|uniref:Uncharacterized protein n=1 Tax=Brassica cretica TaxID=69181 RepID=A0A8S9LYS9_BRACR|nr:hypothetical protein F2Q70_00007697 [Brassica cretica]
MQVTGLAVDGEYIVSSSADQTLRRLTKDRIESWDAHESSIHAVLNLPCGQLLSGTVRGSIIRWNRLGNCIKKMTGHTSAVYSVDFHASSGLLVSGSEDHHAKIWNDKGIVQSLEHPGCVWDAKFLESGDIVTACSDGVARVWTARDGMIADQTEIDDFDTQLSETKRVKKEFAFFKDAENCPLPKHQTRIESFVKRINMALKLENGDNELSPQHRYILGHPDLFTDPDRSYLEKQHFTFFDTAWRNRQCTFTDSNGNNVGEQRPEVRNIPYERKFDVADTTMIELLQTRTRHPNCPKNVLVISADRDFNMRRSIYKRRKEGMIDGGGLLTKVSHGEWKAQEGAFTRGLREVEEEVETLQEEDGSENVKDEEEEDCYDDSANVDARDGIIADQTGIDDFDTQLSVEVKVIDAVNRNPLCDSHNPLNLDYIDDNKCYHVGYKMRKLASELVLRSLMLREHSVRDVVLITSDYHFLLPIQYLQDEFWCNVMVVKGKDADLGLPSRVIWDDALVEDA